MSTTTVIGHIGEPNLKFTPSGKAVLEFNLAENHYKKDQQGEWQEDGTTWRKVSLWDKKAEVVAEKLAKGDKVIVVGQERMREWESKQGEKGKTLEMRAFEVAIIPKDARKQTQTESRGQEDPWAPPGASDNNWGNGADAEPPF